MATRPPIDWQRSTVTPSHLVPFAPPPPATGFMENFSASRDEALLAANTYAEPNRLRDGYGAIVDAVNQGRPAGQQFRNPADLTMFPEEEEMRIFDEIGRRRRLDPQYLAGVPDNAPAFRAQLTAQAQARLHDIAQVHAGATRLGTLGTLVGGLEGSMQDSANLFLLPMGGAGGESYLGRVGYAAISNALVEAALQPVAVHNYANLGEELTPWDSARSILYAGIGGGLLHGTVEGGIHVARGAASIYDRAAERLFNAMPESVQQRWRGAQTIDDVPLTDILHATIPEEHWTPDLRAAVNVAERERDLRASSPFEPGQAGDTIHAESLQAALDRAQSDRNFGGNRVFPRAPGVQLPLRDGGIRSEAGYAYRTMGPSELADAREQGAFLPPPGDNPRYGGGKQWIDGATGTNFNPGGQTVVRVPLDRVSPGRPVAFADAEIVLSPASPRGTSPRPAAPVDDVGAIDDYMAHVGRHESGGRDSIDNPTPGQTAGGRFQFTDGTFRTYYRRLYGTDPGPHPSPALKHDGAIQVRLMRALTADNAATLRHGGFAVDRGNLFLLHFLGPEDGIKVLRAAGDTPVEGLIHGESIAANPTILPHRRAGDVIAWAHRAMGGHVDPEMRVAAAPEAAALGDGGAAELADAEALAASRAAEAPAPTAHDAVPAYESAPVLRRDLFGSEAEWTIAQDRLERDFTDRAGIGAPESGNGAPGRETAAGGATGPAAENALEAADYAGVVFHGTNREFDRFELTSAMRNDGGPVEVMPQAHFFSDNPHSAMVFARDRSRIDAELRGLDVGVPRVSAHRLRIEQPLDFTMTHADAPWLAENGFENWRDFDAPNPLLAEEMQHVTGHSIEDWQDVQRMLDDPHAVAALRRDGFDAVRLREDDGSDSWAVFDPEQIQSAHVIAAPTVAEQLPALQHFSEPGGAGAAAQVDSLEHDLRAALEADPQLGDRHFAVDDAAPRPLTEILAELDSDVAAAAEIRACL